MLKEAKSKLVVGIGNPLRSDDGLGPFIVQKIEEKMLPGIVTRLAHQLNIELLEEVQDYETVLIVDASYLDEGFSLRKVEFHDSEIRTSSHHFSPDLFCSLSQKLYSTPLNLFLCAVQGKNFEVGDCFSEDVLKTIPNAIAEIQEFLKEK